MGSRNVPDRNTVVFGIPSADVDTEIDYVRDEAIKDLELKNQQLQDQIALLQQPAPATTNIIGGLAIEASIPTGLPQDGMAVGSGIYCVGSEIAPKNTTCVFDRAGNLGLGSNVFIGLRQYDDASSAAAVVTEVIAYQPQTGTITSLGFPTTGVTGVRIWQMIIVGSSLYLKRIQTSTYNPIYRWASGSGWSTVSGSGGMGYMSKMVLGGAENLVVTALISSVRRMGYIDPAAPTTLIGSTTLGATVFVTAKNSFLWRSDGNRAAAAASPTWTQVVPTMSYATEFETGRVDVNYGTGDLGVLRRFGTPTAFGVEYYAYTNGAAAIFQNLWTITGNEDDGEPRTTGIRLYVDEGFYVSGFLSEDYYEGTTGSTKYYPAIWASDGAVTTLLRSDPSGLGNATPPDPFVIVQADRDPNGIILSMNYGLEGATPTLVSTSQIDVLLL